MKCPPEADGEDMLLLGDVPFFKWFIREGRSEMKFIYSDCGLWKPSLLLYYC
jgi:hypothetical protein